MHPSVARVAIAAIASFAVSTAQQPVPVVIDPAAHHSRTVVAGDTVHVFTWPSTSATTFPLRYNRSDDCGKTWLPAPLTLANVTALAGAIADGPIVVLSIATATGPMLLRSLDAGATWLPAIPMHPGNPGQRAAALLMVQGVLLATWSEPRVGPGDVYVNRSFDHGLTWGPTDTRIDVSAIDQASSPWFLGDAQAIYVAYQDGTYPQESTWISKSLDLGVTWDANARLVANGWVAMAAAGPVLLADFGGAIQRSADHGATWTATPFPAYSAFAIAGSTAILSVFSTASAGRIPMHSVDAGATWQQAGPPLQLWGHTVQVLCSLHGDTAVMAVMYFPSCCSPTLTSFYVSTDRGASWRLGMTIPYWYPNATGMPNGLLATYSSSGVEGIVYHGFHRYGVSTPGSGAIAPTLHRSGTPSLGETVGLSIEDAVGGSLAAIGASFAGPASQPIGNATILIAPPVISTWLVTSGAFGAPGVGHATMQFTIPAATSFYGLVAHLQGFVLDAGSSAGFSATSGLEMVIR
jgi:hypothetical protein